MNLKLTPLKKLNKLTGSFGSDQIILVVIAAILAACAITAIPFYLEMKSYPKFSVAEMAEYEAKLNDAFTVDHDESIEALRSLPALPKLLENRRNYMLGRLYYAENELVLAYYHLHKITKGYIPEHSLYLKTQIAASIGLEASLLRDLNSLRKQFPKEPKFVYELAKSYSRQSDFERAREYFSLLQEKFPESDFSVGADYYLANLSSDTTEKLTKLKHYLDVHQNGGLAVFVADQIIAFTEKLSDPKITEEDKQVIETCQQQASNNIALAYFYHENYRKALEFFSSTAPAYRKVIGAYATSLVKLKQKTKAIQLLLKELPQAQSTQANALLDKLLAFSSHKYQALANLRALMPKMTQLQDRIAWEIAQRTKSKLDFQKVYESYPDSKYSAESMWRVFWMEYKRKAYHQAIELAKQHWNSYTETRSHAKTAFWAAKILLLQGKKQQAHQVLRDIIEVHPFDYYRFRAEALLKEHKSWYKLKTGGDYVTYPKWVWPEVYTDAEISKNFGASVLELIKAKAFNYLIDLQNQKVIALDKRLLMWIYSQAGNNLKAISTAYLSMDKKHGVDIKDLKQQYAFPLAYSDLVADEVATKLKLDPLLVHALMKQESRYQKDIVSKVGAIGLMQLMPYTAKDVARTSGLPRPSIDDLMQPATNIKLGVNYMERVFDDFNNNMVFAIASYNAGPVAVKRWMRKYSTKDMDKFIEEIPYNETRGYVKKVLANFWLYKQLYT